MRIEKEPNKNKIISFRIDDKSYAELKRKNIDVAKYLRECIDGLLKELAKNGESK